MMQQPPPPFSPLARQLVAQCRREIAAAWEQIEAGRRILEHSAWLLQRWAEQARRAAAALPVPRQTMGGSFEPVAPEPRRKRRRRAPVQAGMRRPVVSGHRRVSPAGAP